MEFKHWKGFCLCSLGGGWPEGAVSVSAPFHPLVFTVRRDGEKSRGWFAVSSMTGLEETGTAVLLPAGKDSSAPLADFVARNGATVLNTAFSHAFAFLAAEKKRSALRLTLVGLGDVGGTLLTALKLLGHEIAELKIYDPNTALCHRYEQELNQVLSCDGAPLPRVSLCPPEQLFDCDLFLFTASRGVPAVGAKVQDVRMAQYGRNRDMLASYARQARQAAFSGLFCQISDPVDQLSRAVFLQSNRDENGNFDGKGLLPEQIQGFGLGVMAARAAYYAEKLGIDFSSGCVYGPHGQDLIVANDGTHYCEATSRTLTAAAVTANLQVRELGFKPYIAPALSSAASEILRLVRGLPHYGAVPMDGVYFGCRSTMTRQGLRIERRELHPALYQRIRQVYQNLEAFSYD